MPLGGGCIGLSDGLATGLCSGFASAVGEATTEFVSGDTLNGTSIAEAGALGFATGLIHDPYPLVGRKPFKFKNLFNPGKNAGREYINGLEKGALASLAQSFINLFC